MRERTSRIEKRVVQSTTHSEGMAAAVVAEAGGCWWWCIAATFASNWGFLILDFEV